MNREDSIRDLITTIEENHGPQNEESLQKVVSEMLQKDGDSLAQEMHEEMVKDGQEHIAWDSLTFAEKMRRIEVCRLFLQPQEKEMMKAVLKVFRKMTEEE
jgi:hypothetical protein